MGDKPSLRWGVEQKLQFIEFRLFWEGHVNRGDLIDKFGISQNQASGDLNRYIALAPDNMIYDKSGKSYVRSSSFNPIFLKSGFALIQQLGSVSGSSPSSSAQT